jgi:hypothetical protein
MSLLTMMQQIAPELNLAIPSAVISSQDQTVKQLLALANREGQQLAKNYDWPVLQSEYTFNLVNTQASYAFPDDYDRQINRTQWDRTNHWPLVGPMSPQEYQWRVSGITVSTPRRRWRIMGNGPREFYIYPVPDATSSGGLMVFEYISKNWCQSATGTGQTTWMADNDTGILDEDLMTMGIKWRFLKAKGLNYDEEYREYQASCDRNFAQAGGGMTLSISNRSTTIVGLTPLNIPDANWPGP